MYCVEFVADVVTEFVNEGVALADAVVVLFAPDAVRETVDVTDRDPVGEIVGESVLDKETEGVLTAPVDEAQKEAVAEPVCDCVVDDDAVRQTEGVAVMQCVGDEDVVGEIVRARPSEVDGVADAQTVTDAVWQADADAVAGKMENETDVDGVGVAQCVAEASTKVGDTETVPELEVERVPDTEGEPEVDGENVGVTVATLGELDEEIVILCDVDGLDETDRVTDATTEPETLVDGHCVTLTDAVESRDVDGVIVVECVTDVDERLDRDGVVDAENDVDSDFCPELEKLAKIDRVGVCDTDTVIENDDETVGEAVRQPDGDTDIERVTETVAVTEGVVPPDALIRVLVVELAVADARDADWLLEMVTVGQADDVYVAVTVTLNVPHAVAEADTQAEGVRETDGEEVDDCVSESCEDGVLETDGETDVEGDSVDESETTGVFDADTEGDSDTENDGLTLADWHAVGDTEALTAPVVVPEPVIEIVTDGDIAIEYV